MLDEKQKKFLKFYALTGIPATAAKASRIARASHYRWLAIDEYAAAAKEAQEEAVERLEAEAHRRAHDGVLEPKYYRAKKLCNVRRYSDNLLMFALKALRPDKYRDNVKVEHSGDLAVIVERLTAARKRINGK